MGQPSLHSLHSTLEISSVDLANHNSKYSKYWCFSDVELHGMHPGVQHTLNQGNPGQTKIVSMFRRQNSERCSLHLLFDNSIFNRLFYHQTSVSSAVQRTQKQTSCHYPKQYEQNSAFLSKVLCQKCSSLLMIRTEITKCVHKCARFPLLSSLR